MNYLADPRAFPVLIIILYIAAALRYAFSGIWTQTAYWLAAAVLNITVLAMSKT